MLKFYIKLAGILDPVRKLVAFIGIAAVVAIFIIFFMRSDERGSDLIFLCLSIALLCIMLYSVSRYFLNFSTSVGDTKGIIKRLRIRLRIAVAWLFSVVMSLVLIKIILLSINILKRI